MRVAGVDACRTGWVAVVLENGRFADAGEFGRFADLVTSLGGASVIAVDMPIGLGDEPPRPADLAAKAFLRPFGSRVFAAPTNRAAAAPSFADARAIQPSLSAQGYALAAKIREVELDRDDRVIEVHPEVSFAELGGGPLAAPKKTWNGQMERRRLLAGAGIDLPDVLPIGAVAADDVLDAAVVAWSAGRYARGEALPLPEGRARGELGVIWR